MPARFRLLLLTLTAGVAMVAPAHAQGPAGSITGEPFGYGSSLVGSAPTGMSPSALAVDPATHTIYVADGYNDNGPFPGGDTISVIDARDCNAGDVSRCVGPWPTVTVGSLPSGIAIDENTDTVYVTNAGDDTVSVVDGATCNALNHSGCGQKAPAVPVGSAPIGPVFDPSNHTLYVANYGAPAFGGSPGNSTTVSMLNGATCNAAHLSGCPTTAAPTVDVGAAPDDVDVDLATHTVYVTTIGALNGWSVFDANTCNASTQAGCDSIGDLPGDPVGPNAGAVDTANDTLYTANYDNTISAFNMARCNATDLSGCATDTPGTVTVPADGFDHTLWLAVDAPLHSVYVSFQKDDALRVIDTDLCSGTDPSGCTALAPPEIHTGASPEAVALDPQTQTLYTADTIDGAVSVIDPARCDAQTASGCRSQVPEVAVAAAGLASDPTVATTYVANGGNTNTVSMIDTSTCNAHRAAGCSATPPTATVGTNPQAVAVDPITHTAYVANFGAGATGTVTILNEHKCNSTNQGGCTTVSTLEVPDGNPDDIAVNPRTDTIYVATLTRNGGPDLISVFNGKTCNATTTRGCGQTPATIATGSDGGDDRSTESVAVDPSTNTIYVTSYTLGDPFLGHSVYVVDGLTCDATDTTGCGNPPATISLGSEPLFGDANPFGIAIDDATDTIYTSNFFNGEGPGTVSIINGAICNSYNTSGCDQTPATAPAGYGTVGIEVDQTTNQVYATSIYDTSVTTINGNTCNGSTSQAATPREPNRTSATTLMRSASTPRPAPPT